MRISCTSREVARVVHCVVEERRSIARSRRRTCIEGIDPDALPNRILIFN
jgi:hypothetical protein